MPRSRKLPKRTNQNLNQSRCVKKSKGKKVLIVQYQHRVKGLLCCRRWATNKAQDLERQVSSVSCQYVTNLKQRYIMRLCVNYLPLKVPAGSWQLKSNYRIFSDVQILFACSYYLKHTHGELAKLFWMFGALFIEMFIIVLILQVVEEQNQWALK